MSGELSFDRARTGILSLDLQQGVVSAYVNDEGFLNRVAAVMRHARRLQVPIVHVKVGFRPGVPEASPRNVFLSAVKASVPHQKFFQGDSGAIHPSVGADNRDLVVVKNRIGAFAGTDLDLLLRAHGVDTLVMFGIATSGVVLSTALQAADLDYRVIVLKDCCADSDQDTHLCTVEKLLPRLTAVTSSTSFQDAS